VNGAGSILLLSPYYRSAAAAASAVRFANCGGGNLAFIRLIPLGYKAELIDAESTVD
jgi:hypothetical protein